jgi:microsomal dipeptidase-like Zn-dependent dipeptidase
LHDRNNEIGFNQRSQSDGPLTAFGLQVVEKMNELGILIDVAHSKTKTLKSIAAASKSPIIDSHTHPLPYDHDAATQSQRLRTWTEMEMIAKTGGVICTWPFAYFNDKVQRTTLKHWAQEISEMKKRLGIEHCGLGTDGGGHLPQVVKGWESIKSLPKLILAMREIDLSQEDIALYVGGNFLRVFNRCLEK